jgi:hypothetical protein
MTFRRRSRLRIAWLALAAMLAGALAPGLSHAMRAASAPGTWGEICRAMPGAALAGVADADPAAPDPQRLGEGPQDCPFCLPHGGHPAPPPAQRTAVPAGPVASALPRLFLLAPSASYPWRAAQPRAPPVNA